MMRFQTGGACDTIQQIQCQTVWTIRGNDLQVDLASFSVRNCLARCVMSSVSKIDTSGTNRIKQTVILFAVRQIVKFGIQFWCSSEASHFDHETKYLLLLFCIPQTEFNNVPQCTHTFLNYLTCPWLDHHLEKNSTDEFTKSPSLFLCPPRLYEHTQTHTAVCSSLVRPWDSYFFLSFSVKVHIFASLTPTEIYSIYPFYGLKGLWLS